MNDMENKYDIFISYRRVGGKDYARIIRPELEKRGFRVFLDFDDLNDGVFNQRIKDAIRDTPVFLLILSKGALDRCVNEGDWVREEILHAQKCHCHIVPVEFDKTFREMPETTPDDISSIIGAHSWAQIDTETLLQESIDKMVSKRIRPYIKQGDGRSDSYANHTKSTALHRIERNGKYGFVNALGEEVIPCEWLKADESFINGIVRVQDNSGRWGFVNAVGNNVIKCKWNMTASAFSDGLLCVKDSNNKWGFINNDGDTVLPFVWDEAKSFSSGLAMVKGKKRRLFLKENSLWGCVDKDGEVIIPYKWQDCGPFFHEGLLNVKDDYNKWGFIDITGKIIIQCKWDNASIFTEGYACVAQNKQVYKYLLLKWGLIDKIGKALVPTDYFGVYNFNNGITCAQKSVGKGWDVINNKGDILFHSESLFPLWFNDGLACVYMNQGRPFLCGFVNRNGIEVIPPVWNHARHFSSGLAPVQNNDKRWGYIDKNGKVVISCQWEDAEPFNGNFAWVKDKDKWFMINKRDF